MYDESKMVSSPGKKLRSSIPKSRFLDIFDGLTAESAVTRLFDHYYIK